MKLWSVIPLFLAAATAGGAADVATAGGDATDEAGAEPVAASLSALSADLAAARDEARSAFQSLDERLGGLETAVAGLSQTAAAGAGEHTLEALRQEVAAMRERVDALPTVDGFMRHPRVEAALASQGDRARLDPDYSRFAAYLAGLAAFLAFGGIVSVVMMRPSGKGALGNGAVERRLKEIKELLAASPDSGRTGGGDAAAIAAAVGTLTPVANAIRAAAETSERKAAAIATAVERLESAGADLGPAVETIRSQLHNLEANRTALQQEGDELEKRRSAAAAAEAAGAGYAGEIAALKEQLRESETQSDHYQLMWPEAFHRGGALAGWTQPLAEAVSRGDAAARRLQQALAAWQTMRADERADRERWIDATDAVGRACYEYLAADPAAGSSDLLEQTQTWTRAFKTALEEHFPSLKLNAVYAGDRFDTDRMESVRSLSGGRQTVDRPLSWFILEKTADTTRVVRRAQVVTT